MGKGQNLGSNYANGLLRFARNDKGLRHFARNDNLAGVAINFDGAVVREFKVYFVEDDLRSIDVVAFSPLQSQYPGKGKSDVFCERPCTVGLPSEICFPKIRIQVSRFQRNAGVDSSVEGVAVE